MNWSRVFVAGVGVAANEWSHLPTRTKETGGLVVRTLVGIGFGVLAAGSALSGWWFMAVVFGLIAVLCIKSTVKKSARAQVPLSQRPDVAAYSPRTAQALSVTQVYGLVLNAARNEARFDPALLASANHDALVEDAIAELERSGYRVTLAGRRVIARAVREAAEKYAAAA